MTARQRAYRERRKQRARALILEAKGAVCGVCGGAFDPPRLHLHHVNRDRRFVLGNWSQHPTRSLQSLRAELAKCRPLCARCHGVEHSEEHSARAKAIARDRGGRFVRRQPQEEAVTLSTPRVHTTGGNDR